MNKPLEPTDTLLIGIMIVCLLLLLSGCATTSQIPVKLDCPPIPRQYTDPIKVPAPEPTGISQTAICGDGWNGCSKSLIG